MKTKIERLMKKRDRLQTKLSQCESQIEEEQRKEKRKEELKRNKKEQENWGHDETKTLIESPFDIGKVYSVNVSVGDTVKNGDTLFVLESMKMEIPILAPKDGTVVQVNAYAGDELHKNVVLAVIDTW